MSAKRVNMIDLMRFRMDLNSLSAYAKYSNRDIAARIGVDPTNLSSYRTGKKDPGLEIIERFYAQFGSEITNVFRDGLADTQMVEESKLEYIATPTKHPARNYQDELIDALKSENDFLKEQLRIINRTHQQATEASQKIAEANQQLAQSMKTLVENAQKTSR